MLETNFIYLAAKIKKGLTNTIRLGTRGSRLALWQANYTKDLLAKKGYSTEIVIIKTRGDHLQHLSFDKIEGKGFFTQELELALQEERVDVAVHSMKDLPTQFDRELMIGGVSERANPADQLLIRREAVASDKVLRLGPGAKVGTSSVRRKALIKDVRPDVVLADVRGNVPTRVDKLREGQFDAIVLASAGLERLDLDLSDLERITLEPREFIPAPAQGVIAFQCRRQDPSTREALRSIHRPEVSAKTNIERSVLRLFDGGCHLPLGAYCDRDGMGNYHVWAAFAPDLDTPLRRTRVSYSTSVGLAEAVVDKLKNE